VDEIEGGGQAHVLIVVNNDGERRIAKIYHLKNKPKNEVLQRVCGASFEHVVRLFEHGQSDGHWYELLEYIELGSLADLIICEGRKLPEARIREILVELATAINHLHEHDLVHRDIKPSNVLVRSLQPLDLVLADFGITSSLQGATSHRTTAQRTPEYAALETSGGEVSKASDWWSVGIILLEMLNGQHPFSEFFDDDADTVRMRIMSRLAYVSMDELSEGIAEPWRTLCRGLLRRQPKNRWGYSEIARWLDGDKTLCVIDEAVPSSHEHPPFFFAGHNYDELTEIGRVFGENWPEARRVVERGHLLNWVKDDLKDNEWRQFLTDLDRDCPDLDERVFRIIVKLDAQSIPVFCGYSLDLSGLLSLVDDATTNKNEAISALQNIFGRGILEIAAKATGKSRFKELQDGLTSVTNEYRNFYDLVTSAGAPTSAISRDHELPRTTILRSLLPGGDDYVATLQKKAEIAASVDARECPWFRELADKSRSHVAASLLVPLFANAAEAQTKERRQAEQEAARQRRYDDGYQAFSWVAGCSVGAMVGLIVGFIPCWVVTGIIRLEAGASTAWGWYYLLMFACSMAGMVFGHRLALESRWVASANRDPSVPPAKGLLIAIPSIVVAGYLVVYWINLDQQQESQRLAAFVANVLVGTTIDNSGHLGGIGTTFQGPTTSIVGYFSYRNGKVGSDIVSLTLVGGSAVSNACNPITLQYASGSVWCKWDGIGGGSYAIEILLNQQVVGRSALFTVWE
jgi:serine/threonine protein kinase